MQAPLVPSPLGSLSLPPSRSRAAAPLAVTLPWLSRQPLSCPSPALWARRKELNPPLLAHPVSPQRRRGLGYALPISAEQVVEKREKWTFEPVGDGDFSHIGMRVSLPKSFELASDNVTVGRVSDKSDIVIPVATVSGVHARLEKKDGVLYVTDLNSTNGTYVGEEKLKPGATMPVSPGSCIIFGDQHLAAFMVSKVEEETSPTEAEQSSISENKIE